MRLKSENMQLLFPPQSQSVCRLCGLTCPDRSPKKEIRGEPCGFCCAGCLHVYEILAHLPGGPPENFRETNLFRDCLAAGLIPENQADVDRINAHNRESGQPENIEQALSLDLDLKIEGMWCTACTWLIETVLGKTDGVTGAQIQFLSDTAKIAYLPYRITPEAIMDRIGALGYRALSTTDSAATDRHKKDLLFRLGIAAILTMNIMMISAILYYGLLDRLESDAVRYMSWPLLLLATPVVFYSGRPILARALAGLRHAGASMDILIAIGALSAYTFSLVNMIWSNPHLYFDTAAMLITLVLLGRFIEYHAREKVTAGISSLYQLSRQKVRLVETDGITERWISPEAVTAGSRFSVISGEQVPIDGQVLTGEATLDLSIITGESRPVGARPGERVRSGSRLVQGKLVLASSGPASESTLNRIIKLMENALSGTNRAELLADRLTRRLVPLIVLLAAGTAAGLLYRGFSPEAALLRAITVLVITCPCALGIAVPLAKVAALGAGRARGILIRDTRVLETIDRLDTVVLDKTGTLTEGDYRLRKIDAHRIDPMVLLRTVAAIEHHSGHYLAREVVRKAMANNLPAHGATAVETVDGMGVGGMFEGSIVVAGNRRMMELAKITVPPAFETAAAGFENGGDTVVFCGIGREFKGLLVFGDAIKPEAHDLVARLKERRIDIHLVSGDSPATTAAVAGRLGIERFVGGALPERKVEIIRTLQGQGRTVGMAGDGMNDAAALAAADVGMAMSAGDNLLREISDLTLAGNNPVTMIDVIRLSLMTGRIIRQNLFFAFIYNMIGIPLAIAGLLHPFMAVTAMFFSSLTVIGNTMRITRFRPEEDRGEKEMNPSAGWRLAANPSKRALVKIIFGIGICTAGFFFSPPDAVAFNSMDEIFLHDAVQVQIYILESAELAAIRSGDENIRHFSHELVKFQGHLNKRIEHLVRNSPPGKNLELPAALSEVQVKTMKILEEAPEDAFNRLFIEATIRGLEELVSVYRRALEYGGYAPALKFASEQIPRIAEFLRQAGKH